MKVVLLPPAENELDDAVAWYDRQISGLGREWLDELDRAIRRALAFPFSYPEIEPGVRRCRLARFPYGEFTELTATLSWSSRSRTCIGDPDTGSIEFKTYPT